MAKLLVRELEQLKGFRIFLSSGKDASAIRTRFHRMADELTAQLQDAELPYRLEIERWEKAAPQKAKGKQINSMFVKKAVNSHVTVVFALDNLWPGTIEEVRAVLRSRKTELAVIWFRTPGSKVRKPLREFLDLNRSKILYLELGDPEEEESWFGLLRVLAFIFVKMVLAPEASTK